MIIAFNILQIYILLNYNTVNAPTNILRLIVKIVCTG